MDIPKIQIDDDSLDISVFCCFILSNFDKLSDSALGEIAIHADAVNYFELMSNVGFMVDKKLIEAERDKKSGEYVYKLLDEGKRLAEEFYMHIPLSLRERTLDVIKEYKIRKERERSILCDILYDRNKNRYDLNVKFINEINGETILDIKLYAPDKKKAEEMRDRFLSKPSFIITRTMNMFLKDDFFMYDK